MRVMPGEIFGLLGPNGAGKSTLVKIMMSVVRPTRAAGTLLGRPLGHKATLARVGYLPEHHRMPPYLSGRQALEFFAALARVDRPTRKRRAAELLEALRMERWADARLRTYSKGMQQRIALAQALMNDPDLVVLDEPTDGLDPNQKHEIRQLIRKMGEKKAIIFSTHILEEVDAVCTRAMIIDRGKVVANGTPEELRRKSEWAGAVTLRINGVAAGAVQEKLNHLRAAKKTTTSTIGTRVTATVFPRKAGDGDLTREVIEATSGWQVEELRTEEGRLDEVFRSITMPDTAGKEAKP
jgi:ABC-2 type transport system ATP-binding protein